MKDPLLKSILILFFLEILLVVSSSFLSSYKINFFNHKQISIRFPAPDQLFDFRIKQKTNTKAEQFFRQYAVNDSFDINLFFKRKKLEFGDKRINKKYFFNPQTATDVFALDNFFNAITELNDTTTIRIAHYGDSQIEGDRLTCFLRTLFQKEFGGSGIGYVPFTDITSHMQLQREFSSNWLRYTIFNAHFKSSYYGLSGQVFNIIGSTYGHMEAAAQNFMAKLSIDLNENVQYDHISLLYGNASSPFKINSFDHISSSKISEDIIPVSQDFNIKKLKINSNKLHLNFDFIVRGNPDLYGFLIDGPKGVQIDNFSIRGHSGDKILTMNTDYLGVQLKRLNTKLVILQFGANVVPYINSETECKRFEKIYYDVFMKFKTACPNLSLLVIGAGDMVNVKNGQDQSYPFIFQIKEAQKRAAIRAGAAYWDLYEMMGGPGSILTMTEKGFASKNGHFTPKGQPIIAGELFNSIMTEYHTFLYRQKKNKLVTTKDKLIK